ncbi:MAG: HAD-IB family hydrolase [Patescibacteria group bacterium]
MNKKRLAIFDIDGTIFRSSLLIELNWMLMKEGIFPIVIKKELDKSFYKWIDRKGSYEDYIEDVVKVYSKYVFNKNQRDIKRIAKKVVEEQKDRVYVYTRDLIKQLRKKYIMVAISGSPVEIVEAFNKYYKFDYIFATRREIKNKKYTKKILEIPALNKKKYIKDFIENNNFNLKGSMGLGDTEADVGFLELVDDPICFNPNKNLYKIARNRNWKIVVERKDVIYNLDFK